MGNTVDSQEPTAGLPDEAATEMTGEVLTGAPTVPWWKRREALTGVAVLIVLLVGGVLWQQRRSEPIVIGALLPLSGVSGTSGELLRNGLLLSLDEVNDNGGINGRPVEIFFRDTRADPEESKKALLEMEAEVRPLLYISALSRVGTAIGPVAEEAEAPLLVLVATSPAVIEDKEWVFKFPQSAAAEVPPALFHFEKLGIQKLGLLYVNDAFGHSLLEGVGGAFEAAGGVVESVSFETEERDFGEYVAQLKDTDAIYFVGLQDHRRAFYPESLQFDYAGHLIGSSDSANEVGLTGTNGLYLAAPALLHNSSVIHWEHT